MGSQTSFCATPVIKTTSTTKHTLCAVYTANGRIVASGVLASVYSGGQESKHTRYMVFVLNLCYAIHPWLAYAMTAVFTAAAMLYVQSPAYRTIIHTCSYPKYLFSFHILLVAFICAFL